MPNSKLIGGILLIVGTSIGGGMLALPISTAAAGITSCIIFLVFCWLVMTAGALLLLEVNLRLPAGSNMVSMAKFTLGLPGQIIAWITYLFLLYTLLAAYISGGGDVLNGILQQLGVKLPSWISAFIFTLIFAAIVHQGIKTVDFVNRGLMFGKLGVYLVLILIISPHMHLSTLQGGSFKAIGSSMMILITSFGFASIVPSLREYFADDIPSLRRAIIIGSLIPLICYIMWNAVIMGVISRDGIDGLISLRHSEHATSGLTQALRVTIGNPWITGLFEFFTSICMVTAFLGVSLGLFDFLADGLKLNKSGTQAKCTLGLTFLPPLVVVLLQPGIYLNALAYAGICCVILMALLPPVMAWRARRGDTNLAISSSRSLLRNISLVALTLVAVLLLCLSFFINQM